MKEGEAYGVKTLASDSGRKEYSKACGWCISVNHSHHQCAGSLGQCGNTFSQGVNPPASSSAQADGGVRGNPEKMSKQKAAYNFWNKLAA